MTRVDRLAAALERAVADPLIGGAIGAVHAPRLGIAWEGAAGTDGLDGTRPLSPAQPFRIASTTKIFVAAALLRLVEQDRVGLETHIAALIAPETAAALMQGGYDPARITLAHLMGHTSGLRDHVQTPVYVDAVMADPARRWTRADQLSIALGDGPPWGEPGTWFRYSDTGYVILGEIIERLTDGVLGPAVRGLIDYARLGLASTWWERDEPPPAHTPPRARQYFRMTETTHIDPSSDLFGGGGLISTVGDIARFTRALILGEVFARPGTLAAGLLISPATRAPEAFYIHSTAFMLFPMGARFGWGHAGFWGCVGVCAPDLDLTIAATINQARPETPDALKRLVADLAEPALG